MKIHGMALLRNEDNRERWLGDFNAQMKKICDRVVILDDCSTDSTYSICQTWNFEMNKTENQLWETNEIEARKSLWNKTIEKCNDGDWILCLDGDELFIVDHIPYIKYTFKHLYNYSVDSIGFKLFDMWNNTHYRDDKYWTAHYRYWAMAVRYWSHKEYKWSDRKLHCGRFPLNSAEKMCPTNIPIQHMGWSTEKLRMQKYDRYMKIDGDGKSGILEQYYSIIDKNPNLKEF
jgi:glycosyltransferase involved in cell wall biosynthesis